jgi:coatomer protein complex subunit gamma
VVSTPSVVTALGGGPETLKSEEPEQPRKGGAAQFELLTDTATEYVVSYRKFSEPEQVTFEFHIDNTLESTFLENVSIDVNVDGIEGLTFVKADRVKVIEPNGSAKIQVVYSKEDRSYPTGDGTCTLVFSMREEGDDEGQDEEVPLEDIALGMKDYMQPLETISFGKDWDEIGELEQHTETIALQSMKTLQQAVDEISKFLGMSNIDKSDQVPPKTKIHTAIFAGRLTAKQTVKLYVKAKVFYSTDNVVTLEISVRGGDDEIRQLLIQLLCS